MTDAPAARRCWAEIDLGALERNLRAIETALPSGVQYLAVVKAGAYGHGLGPVVTRFMQSRVAGFAVATLDEARAIRETGSGWPILILGALLPWDYEPAIEQGHGITLSSEGERLALAECARRLRRPASVHIKVDTGMGRLGVWHEDAPALIRQTLGTPDLQVAGIFTHFADAPNDADFTREQRERLRRVLAKTFPQGTPQGLRIHADSSASLADLTGEGPFNTVRVGLRCLGVGSVESTSAIGTLPVEPVLSLRARLALVKHLPAGTSISYGRTYTLGQATRVGVITAGYGDGLPRASGNRAQVLIRGHSCPILGRVCMDQAVVDLGTVPDAEPGDRVTLIGRDGEASISARMLADWSGTIPYEVFCGISARVPRLYQTPRA